MTLSASGTTFVRQFLAFVLIIGFSVGLVAVHAHQDRRLSALDELVHVNSLYQAASGGIAKPGDQIGIDARRDAACRGIDTQPPPSSCQPLTEPAPRVASNGAQDPPLYYFATYGMAQAVRATGLVTDLVTAGRIADGVWLGAGLFLLWLVAQELGASLTSRLAMTALLATNGGILYISAVVNPNAAAIAGGAAVLLSTLLWEKRQLALAVPALIAATAMLLTNGAVLGVLAACVYLFARAFADGNPRGRPRRFYLVAGAMLAGVALSAEVAWIGLRSVVSHSSPISGLALPHGLDRVASEAATLITPLSFAPVSPATFHGWPAYLASFLVIGACAGAMLYLKELDRLRSLGLAAILVMLLGGPFVFVTIFVVQRIDADVPLWYGFSLIPALAAVTAAAADRSRLALAALAAVAAMGVWVQFAYLHGPLA